MAMFLDVLRSLRALFSQMFVAAMCLCVMPASQARAQCGGRWLTSPEQSATGLNNGVYALAVLPGGDLVAGGAFSSAGGVTANSIARWTGGSFAPLGSGITPLFDVYSLAVLANGDLVAGGDFPTAGGVTVNKIARWNGVAWASLGTGMGTAQGFAPFVSALALLPNGDLVAGGAFTTAGGVAANSIARWNGASWAPLGSGVAASNGDLPQVYSLAVLPNGDIVAGGLFTTAGGLPANNIARWNGSSWSPLGSGTNLPVLAIAPFPNGDLAVAGQFTIAGGAAANFVANWRGSISQWAPMGVGVNGPAYALAVLPGGDLVASGGFTSAGGVGASRIARWNGSSWAPIGAGMNLGVNALAVMPSGELVAGGVFTAAGGAPSYYWARWTDTGILWFARQPAGPRTIPSVGGALAGAFSVAPASGYDFGGPLTYQWQRNGVNINNGPTSHGTIISGATTATLSFANTSILDSGRYGVVVSNSCGAATSTGVLLTVGSSACPGDATGDGVIGFADLNLVLDRYGASVTPGTNGDVTGDGVVDFFDLNRVLAAYGTGC